MKNKKSSNSRKKANQNQKKSQSQTLTGQNLAIHKAEISGEEEKSTKTMTVSETLKTDFEKAPYLKNEGSLQEKKPTEEDLKAPAKPEAKKPTPEKTATKAVPAVVEGKKPTEEDLKAPSKPEAKKPTPEKTATKAVPAVVEAKKPTEEDLKAPSKPEAKKPTPKKTATKAVPAVAEAKKPTEEDLKAPAKPEAKKPTPKKTATKAVPAVVEAKKPTEEDLKAPAKPEAKKPEAKKPTPEKTATKVVPAVVEAKKPTEEDLKAPSKPEAKKPTPKKTATKATVKKSIPDKPKEKTATKPITDTKEISSEKIGYSVKEEQNKDMIKVIFCASEAAPFVKIGGLGDVASALPKALCDKNIDARVVLPLYSQISQQMREKMAFKCSFWFTLGWRRVYCGIFEAKIGNVTYYLLDNEQYFKRNATYGEYDDGERFGFFSKAVLEIIPYIDFYPDVIHANDWHSALVPVYLDTLFRNNPGYQNIKTVFSIHNIEFQGKYDPIILGNVFGIDARYKDILFDGEAINLMKGAIECSNIITTVSKTYAQEILTPFFSWGLDGILRQRSYKLRGIVNGIDTELFDPKTDKLIKTNYSLKTINKKSQNKAELQHLLGLPENENAIVVGMVTRLTPQKGIDLFYQAMDEMMKENIQFIILGTGYRHFEDFFRSAQYRYPDRVCAYLDFSPEIASKIYAGSDLFLMPSKAEPCGLAQLIAMAYGTIPVVHEIGGLKDTVCAYNPQEKSGTGITFKSYNPYDMADAVKRACQIFSSEEDRKAIIANAMNSDFSWNTSAEEYISIYEELTGMSHL